MNFLKMIDKGLAKIIEVLMIASIYIMTVYLGGNVFARAFLKTSIISAEEICRYCIIIMTFVALAYIAQQDKHVKISLVYDILPWKVKKVMSVIVYFISAGIIGYIAFKSYGYVNFTVASGRTSSILAIPVSYVSIAVFVGFMLLAIEYFIEAIMNLVSRDAVYTGRLSIPMEEGKEAVKNVDDN